MVCTTTISGILIFLFQGAQLLFNFNTIEVFVRGIWKSCRHQNSLHLSHLKHSSARMTLLVFWTALQQATVRHILLHDISLRIPTLHFVCVWYYWVRCGSSALCSKYDEMQWRWRCRGEGSKFEASYLHHRWDCNSTNMKPHVLYSMRLRSAHCTILYQAVPMWSPIENPLDQAPPPPYEDKYPQLDFYQWGQSHRCYQGLGWVGEVISAGVSHF